MKFIVHQSISVFFNNNGTTQQPQYRTKQNSQQRDKVQTKCKRVSGSALQYRSAVQQPDCLGEEAVTQTSGARFNTSVALIGGE